MGFVALLPPADMQLFWKLPSLHGPLISDVLTLLFRCGQTLVTDGLLIHGRRHSFPVWVQEALFEYTGFSLLRRE